MAEQNCCALELNPDITGIGVRVALYVQILLGWIMSLRWPNTFVENSRAAYMTALALLIASFIEATTQTLSLLDGIVVSFITTMMVVFAIASYARLPDPEEGDEKNKSADDKRSITRWFMQFSFVIFWAAWCFYLWRDPAHFGLKGEAANCDTNTKIIIQLFTQVSATDPRVRRAAIALVAIGFSIALLSLFFTLEQFLLPIFWVIGKTQGKKEDEPITARDIKLKYENDPVLQGIHMVFQLIAVGTFVFLIYATERTIVQNDVDRTTRDWSYGQTIALILLLQQIMQLFSTHIEEREKKEREREKENLNGDFPGISLPTMPPRQSDMTPSATDPVTPGSK